MAQKLFVRRRDGRIEVRLNEDGRAFVADVFSNVLAAERDPDHRWHISLNGPIDPSQDADNPLSILSRQSETSTNAELAMMTVADEFLNESEAWTWLTTLQVAMRSTVQSYGLLDEEKLREAPPEVKSYLENLQLLLFQLAESF